MKMRELFKKVETYNEVAELMCAPKARICFTYGFLSHEEFDNYNEFRKFVRKELVDELVEFVCNSDSFEFDKEVHLDWTDAMGSVWGIDYCAELVSC